MFDIGRAPVGHSLLTELDFVAPSRCVGLIADEWMLWPLLIAAVCSLLAVMIGVVRSEGLRRCGASNTSDVEQLLNQLADDDCCISFTADDRQHVTWVSESFLQVVGRPSVECIGRNILDVLQDDGRDTALFIRFGEALCEQRRFTGELHLISASGEDYWLELVARPLCDNQGSVSGWMGFGRLCTERKRGEEYLTCSQAKSAALIDELRAEIAYRTQSEATLREAVAYLDVYRMIVDHHAIVAETDTRGIIVSVNDAFCRISGYSREELIGRNHRILNSGVHPKSMWQEMYRTVARGGFWHGDICNRAKDGSLYWVDTTIAPLHNDKGQVRGYFAIRADITALKEAQVQAEAASRAKSEFLANMSHEIRTPMTAILGFADLLAEDADRVGDRNQRLEAISTIKRNGEHLLSIINDILDISKIEADKMTLEHIETSPEQIIQEVLSLMRVKAEAKGLTLQAEFVTAIPKSIRSDPTRLRQILMNLVGNAIKFTEVGVVTMRIALVRGSSPKLQVEVVDTGIGLTDSQVGRLFNYFEQADASTTRRFGGSGLGLRISKRLAKMLGGDITVRSTFGRGSSFTLTVAAGPLDKVQLVELNPGYRPPMSAVPSKPAIERPLSGVRILLAEDGPDNQRLFSFHLRKAGAHVQVADNGRAAVELLTRDGTIDGELLEPLPYDLIITDIQMPEMDGYRATRLLRSKGCSIPILALTAHAMAGDLEKCLAAGCNAHLTKPIDKSSLVRECAAWLEPTDRVSMRMDDGGSRHAGSIRTKLRSELADDEEMVPLILAFLAGVERTVPQLHELAEARDFKRMSTMVHQLKGAAGGYGYPDITDAARKLEQALSSGHADSEIRSSLDSLSQLCESAVRESAAFEQHSEPQTQA